MAQRRYLSHQYLSAMAARNLPQTSSRGTMYQSSIFVDRSSWCRWQSSLCALAVVMCLRSL